MKEKLKNWKIWLGMIIVILIIFLSVIFLFRNKLTPEETVSRFMYLIENKQYEEAKKLCNTELEHLDLLANVNPSKLTFKFSEDKKIATAILLEEDIESTNLNIKMENTIWGWKINGYNVTTDLIDPQIIENKLEQGKDVSDTQILYWGESDISSKEKISKYVKNNGIVALIFAELMKFQKYEKASEMYTPILDSDLTIEQLKEYNWDNYQIESNFELFNNFNGITVKINDKKLYIYVAGGTIMDVALSNV